MPSLSDLLREQQVVEEPRVGLGEALGEFGKSALTLPFLLGGLIKSGVIGAARGYGTPVGALDTALREMTKTAEGVQAYNKWYTPELENPIADLALGIVTDPTAWVGGGSIPSIVKSLARPNIVSKVGSRLAPQEVTNIFEQLGRVGPTAKTGEATARELAGRVPKATKPRMRSETEALVKVERPATAPPVSRVPYGEWYMPAEPIRGPKQLKEARVFEQGPAAREMQRSTLPQELMVAEKPGALMAAEKSGGVAPTVRDMMETAAAPSGPLSRESVQRLANTLAELGAGQQTFARGNEGLGQLAKAGQEVIENVKGRAKGKKFREGIEQQRKPRPFKKSIGQHLGYVWKGTPEEQYVKDFLQRMGIG